MKILTPLIKQITIAEENIKEIPGSEDYREQSEGTCLTKTKYTLLSVEVN